MLNRSSHRRCSCLNWAHALKFWTLVLRWLQFLIALSSDHYILQTPSLFGKITGTPLEQTSILYQSPGVYTLSYCSGVKRGEKQPGHLQPCVEHWGDLMVSWRIGAAHRSPQAVYVEFWGFLMWRNGGTVLWMGIHPAFTHICPVPVPWCPWLP